MSNFPHDDFAKAYLTEILSTIGKAIPNYPLNAETRQADLWFELNSTSETALAELGLLGRLLPQDSLIEIFRNPATVFEIGGCKNKRFSLEAELVRKAKRQDKTLTESELPHLLLLMPTASQEIRDGFSVTQTETSGVYEFPRFERSRLVILHQLPKTQDTLWLRLLARAGEQRRAIEEFAQMSAEVPLNATIGELLADYRAILEASQSTTHEEEELIMNLSAAYLKKKEEWREEVALNLLRDGIPSEVIAKATELTIEQVNKLREQLD